MILGTRVGYNWDDMRTFQRTVRGMKHHGIFEHCGVKSYIYFLHGHKELQLQLTDNYITNTQYKYNMEYKIQGYNRENGIA